MPPKETKPLQPVPPIPLLGCLFSFFLSFVWISFFFFQRPIRRGKNSGELALSRAISGPRCAISGDLGASLARRHTCSKKEGPGWSHGAHEDVLARFSPPRPAPLGPVRRRPARRVPRPVTPTPARTAHLQPSRGYSRAHAGPGGDSLPPTSDGLGRFCAPWRLRMSRVPACQG